MGCNAFNCVYLVGKINEGIEMKVVSWKYLKDAFIAEMASSYQRMSRMDHDMAKFRAPSQSEWQHKAAESSANAREFLFELIERNSQHVD